MARNGQVQNREALETDYLVIGGGAMGVAFADAQEPELMNWLKHARLDGWSSPSTSAEQDAALTADMLSLAPVAVEKLQAHLAACEEA